LNTHTHQKSDEDKKSEGKKTHARLKSEDKESSEDSSSHSRQKSDDSKSDEKEKKLGEEKKRNKDKDDKRGTTPARERSGTSDGKGLVDEDREKKPRDKIEKKERRSSKIIEPVRLTLKAQCSQTDCFGCLACRARVLERSN